MRWLLWLTNAHAITMPWSRVYVLNEDWADDPGLQVHEAVHLYQIRRDGRVRFTLNYLWWLIRYGYWNNPYEVEARRHEMEFMQEGLFATDDETHTERTL